MFVRIRALSPFAIDGGVIKAGAEVDVSKNTARNLLQRGKAELATGDADDLAPSLEEMTDDALQDLAAEYGVAGLPKSFSRARWIKALAAHEAAALADEGGAV